MTDEECIEYEKRRLHEKAIIIAILEPMYEILKEHTREKSRSLWFFTHRKYYPTIVIALDITE